MTKRKYIFNSFRWQNDFESLIQKRQRMGMSLERMAELMTDMANLDDSIYVPVTAQELEALESDIMHGMDPLAVAYVRFMGGISGIGMGDITSERDVRKLLSYAPVKDKSMKEKNERIVGIFQRIVDGELLCTCVSVIYTDVWGEKGRAELKPNAIGEVAFNRMMNILLESAIDFREIIKKGGQAYYERLNQFKGLYLKRKSVKDGIKELLGNDWNDRG